VVTKAGLTVDLHEGIKEDVNIYLKGEAQKSKRGEEIYRGGYTMTLLLHPLCIFLHPSVTPFPL
jgi:hypothetical protein